MPRTTPNEELQLIESIVKKQQETPKADLDLAIERHKELKRK